MGAVHGIDSVYGCVSMNVCQQLRGRLTGSAFAAGRGPSARLRQQSACALLFSLLTFVLTFGAPVLRSVSIFEEDLSEIKARVELAPMRITSNADHRHRLPDYLPWAEGSALHQTVLRQKAGETADHAYFQTGPPASRAPPSRLA
jgi:hypothetical protein